MAAKKQGASGHTVNAGYDRTPDPGSLKTGYALCTIPTETPGIAKGDLLKDVSKQTAASLKVNSSDPDDWSLANEREHLMGFTKLTQNAGEYKDYGQFDDDNTRPVHDKGKGVD